MRQRLTASRLIALSFLMPILAGTFLLFLPISSRAGEFTPFPDALFTATSATCVTGLSVYDTLSYWSSFGKAVILLLIQLGGIGCMTVVTLILNLLGARVTARDESLLMQSVGIINKRDVLHLVRRVALFTLCFEGAGALLLSFRLCTALGLSRGIVASIFTSVSAFCNAGFDLFGDLGAGSLSYFAADPYVLGVLSFLIVSGGLGFIVWSDLFSCRFRLRRLQFHTKAVLAVTLFLLLFGTAFFLLSEWNAAFADMAIAEKLLASAFQSVTTRTAGFYAFDQGTLSGAGVIGSIVLMCIGGSPGSTAGGMKTTTVLVVLLSELSTVRKNREITLFRRRIDGKTVRQASTVAVIYLSLILFSAALISLLDPSHTLEKILFEATSAVATVGLTMGITAELSTLSHLVLIALMYIGRIGGLTFAFVLAERHTPPPISRPTGQLLIG